MISILLAMGVGYLLAAKVKPIWLGILGCIAAGIVVAVIAILTAAHLSVLPIDSSRIPNALFESSLKFSIAALILYVVRRHWQRRSTKLVPESIQNDTVEMSPHGASGAHIKKASTSAAGVTDDIYAKIADELEFGASDTGLWTRLFAESNGDERQTIVRYIKARAAVLLAERKREQNTGEAKVAHARYAAQMQTQTETAARVRSTQRDAYHQRVLDLCTKMRREHLDVHAYAFLAEQVGASFKWENSIFNSCYTFTKGNSVTQFRELNLIRSWYLKNVLPQIEASA